MYESPTLTNLGSLEELTQLTVKVKLDLKSFDIQFNKSGFHVAEGSTGVDISLHPGRR